MRVSRTTPFNSIILITYHCSKSGTPLWFISYINNKSFLSIIHHRSYQQQQYYKNMSNNSNNNNTTTTLVREERSPNGNLVVIPHKGFPSLLHHVNTQHVLDNQNWEWVFDDDQRDFASTDRAVRTKTTVINKNDDTAIAERIALIQKVMKELKSIGQEELQIAAKELCEKLEITDIDGNPADNLKKIVFSF